MGEQNWGLSVVKVTEKVMTQRQNKQSYAFQWARTKKNGDSPAPGDYGSNHDWFTWAAAVNEPPHGSNNSYRSGRKMTK